MENGINGPCMVFHIEPVAHILATPIDGQGLTLANVVNEERNQFFGELIGTVIVRAVSDDDGHTIGVMVGSDEMVARCLRCAIGRMRIVFGGFHKKLVAVGFVAARRGASGKRGLDSFRMSHFQRTVHLIG